MLIRSKDGSRLHRRQCVACGYSGRFIDQVERSSSQAHCPRCSCDFGARPPKSYAEMEGIVEEEPRARRSARMAGFQGEQREWRLVERWLLFFFVVSVLCISMLALTIAALPMR